MAWEPVAEANTTELVKENPIRYAGYYWDRKTQFYYLQARYYDPRPARFISEDTYEGEIDNPQSLNMYVYVENNPLNFVDPTGHMKWSTKYQLGKGFGASIKDLALDLVGISEFQPTHYKFYTKTIPAAWEFGQALYNGDITFNDIKNGLGSGLREEFIYPFEHLKDNYSHVINGDPTKQEAYDYGYNAGNAIQMIIGIVTLGSELAVKLASKASKLMKIIKDLIKGKGTGNIYKLGGSTLKKFKPSNIWIKNKHLSGGKGTWSKFNVATEAEAQGIVAKAIKNGTIKSITDNKGVLGDKGQKSFEIIIDTGKIVGTKGEKSIRVVIDELGNMWSVFPD